ncbi:MAG TPA: methyltransferase domain-containing protein [bacterium]|nr:methyltransferase domain-containing protein [bacterium]
MPKTDLFDKHADRYEEWFTKHPAAYSSELKALGELWPSNADGLEIGSGAGHFAEPMGIKTTLEPSAAMREAARKRGIYAIDGTAERLPFPDERFDATLMVTTLCFLDDPKLAIQEMFRVLRPAGCAIVGFVDRDSPLGREYEIKRPSSVFYSEARFYGAREVNALLSWAGFMNLESRQTIFRHPDEMQKADRVEAGFGDGLFVFTRGWKPPKNHTKNA